MKLYFTAQGAKISLFRIIIVKKHDVVRVARNFFWAVCCTAFGTSCAWGQAAFNSVNPPTKASKSNVKVDPNKSTLLMTTFSLTTLESVRLLAVDTREQFGVFFVPGQGLISVRSDERIPGTQAELVKVAKDKVVLKELRPDGIEKQLVWLHKTQGKQGGRLERFSKSVVPELYLLPPTLVRKRDPSSNRQDEELSQKNILIGSEQQ